MSFQQQFFFVFGALLGMLSIGAGAFGAHLLRSKLSPDYLNVFEVAVRYQIYHALALIIVALCLGPFASSWFAAAGWSFILGTVLFSGSLYILVLTEVRSWGIITPVGGLFLLIGWACLVLGGMLTRQG
ncbi:conserved putative membrane protein [Candidatus Protochlamydia naegleriophila]|uniref:Conserved putative membrane protein n=2 Tax=Candidatus Protochlamydia naegleriophila TaxID=389348 RepID=A0A0U5JBG6_9BACT|nr:conserved putative membrane protein [Candidatus Protochlamydia naegleriophila]